jgi:hypothetical protein
MGHLGFAHPWGQDLRTSKRLKPPA